MSISSGMISFKHNSEELHLKIKTSAMIKYQEAKNETFFNALDRFQTNPTDIVLMRDLIWCSIVQNKTQEEIAEIMDDLGLEKIMDLFSKATVAAFPDIEKNENSKDKSGNQKSGNPQGTKVPK